MSEHKDGALEDLVRTLQTDLEAYAHHVAGVSCPTECKHFNLFDTSTDHGCTLDTPTPLDCLEATAGDVSRWLIAHGWRPQSPLKLVTTVTEPLASDLYPEETASFEPIPEVKYRILRVRKEVEKTTVRVVRRRDPNSEPTFICLDQ